MPAYLDTALAILAPIFIVSILGLMLITRVRYGAALRRLADEHDLRFDKRGLLAPPRARGTVDGIDVEVRIERPDRGTSITFVTVFETQLDPIVPDSLTVIEPHLIRDLRKRLDDRDIKVGAPSFDRRYRIQGAQPARIRAFLSNRESREKIAEFFDKDTYALIQNGRARIDASGFVSREEQLEHHLELCLDLSRKLGAEHYDEEMTRRFGGEPPARGDAW